MNIESSPEKQSARFDFSPLERRLDAIVQESNEKLRALLDEKRFLTFQERALASLSPPKNADSREDATYARDVVSYQIRLGRTRLSLDELNNLELDAIVPLLDSVKGRVQIWTQGRLFARGVLLVVDGKLAVKVESLEP